MKSHGGAALALAFLITSCMSHQAPSPAPIPRAPSGTGLLRVEGNKIKDQSGSDIVLAGLNICSPAEVKRAGHWDEAYFRELASWGARLVRVPIDPGIFRQYGEDGTFALLDDAIAWAKNYGMYVMIDWHSVGNPLSGVFQPEYGEGMRTTPEEMKEFWAKAASRYADEPVAAFYEIFNEPAEMGWLGGKLTWDQWKALADEVIDVIYERNPRAIPVVGGLDWSFDLRAVGSSPLRNKGVIYAAHPYPGHGNKPWEPNWERYFGYLAKDYPVMLTEFGYDPHDTVLPSVYKADDDYGRRIIAYAREKGMSWTAFVFARMDGWPMPLFSEWENYTPTESGAFFKARLLEQ